MSIHINFREVTGRISDIGELTKIAKAMLGAEVNRVTVYFEFDTPEELMLFCRAVNILPTLRELENLETRKLELTKEIEEIHGELEKLKIKRDKRLGKKGVTRQSEVASNQPVYSAMIE